MSYKKALSKLSKSQRSRVTSRMMEWSKLPNGGRVVRNFDRERFIPARIWSKLLEFIEKNDSLDIVSFESAYEKEIRKNRIVLGKHQWTYRLKGGDIRVAVRPKYLGVAYEFESLRRHLEGHLGTVPGFDAKDFINRLLSDSISHHEKTLIYPSLPLKNYIMFATWNEDEPQNKPFEFVVRGHPDEVRANLGLDRRNSNKPIILLIYKVPLTERLYRPTSLDVGPNQYFEPPAHDKYGHTRPWEIDDRIEALSIKLEYRPETVHHPVTFESIVDKPKILY
ncbi:MAG: hypothetical protein AAF587_34435 [Bacteroidota bacterium]